MHTILAKNILSDKNNMNLYRGCTHGCIYCDSRSACYQMTHRFEDIEVKINAPELLEIALKKKRNKCMITTGAMSDPYLPLESEFQLTRQCLEIINAYGFGISILTKSDLIVRDIDLLQKMNQKTKCVVQMTLTTYNEALCKIVEPNVATTKRRFEVLEILRDAGIPTIVWITPTLPFINDTEENMLGILDYCLKAKVHGILTFGIGMTLRYGNQEYYYKKLEEHFPELKRKYFKTFGARYGISSPNGKVLGKLVKDTCKKHDILYGTNPVFNYLNHFEDKTNYEQLTLF